MREPSLNLPRGRLSVNDRADLALQKGCASPGGTIEFAETAELGENDSLRRFRSMVGVFMSYVSKLQSVGEHWKC